jgi:hypothetical protein
MKQHKEKIKKQLPPKVYKNTPQAIYKRKRRKIDINFKLLTLLRCRVYHALKGHSKSLHIRQLLGCSIDFLKQYLKRQFKSGMVWNNYGFNGWHIDHMRPCCSFNLSRVSEQRKCFHYTNLQPLWAKENRLKNRQDKLMRIK